MGIIVIIIFEYMKYLLHFNFLNLLTLMTAREFLDVSFISAKTIVSQIMIYEKQVKYAKFFGPPPSPWSKS